MKVFEEYRLSDEPGHKTMSGPDCKAHADANSGKTAEERFNYYKDLSTVFPFMMLNHYYPWLVAGLNDVPAYQSFMDEKMPIWQEHNTPIFKEYFDEGTTVGRKTELLATYLDVFPLSFLEDFYNWYGGKRDFTEFRETAAGFMSEKRAEFLKLADTSVSNDEKVELAYYFGTSFIYDITELFHTWARIDSFEEFERKNAEQLRGILRPRIAGLFDGTMTNDEKTDFVLDLVTRISLQIVAHYHSWVTGGADNASGDAAGPGGPGGPPPGGPEGPPPM